MVTHGPAVELVTDQIVKLQPILMQIMVVGLGIGAAIFTLRQLVWLFYRLAGDDGMGHVYAGESAEWDSVDEHDSDPYGDGMDDDTWSKMSDDEKDDYIASDRP